VNRERLSAIAHGGHPVAAPLSDPVVDALLARVAARRPRTVLDVGCGSAQWLVRLLEQLPDARGVGVDLSSDAVAAAHDFAVARGVADRVDVRRQDAAGLGDERYDAVLCIGSTHALGGLAATLEHAHRWGTSDAVALVGDGFWQRAPDRATLDALDASADEFPSYAGLVALVEAGGWAPTHVHVSTLQEWDDYEWSWVSTLTRWARAHPEDPDAADAATFAQQHRDQWLAGYRETLGFAVVLAERRDR
jgi:cyclopropane fatty-acyl-phospholipid synthase-like methyltransferase